MNRSASFLFGLVLVPSAMVTAGVARAATETVLYSFCNQENCPDGSRPEAGVIDVSGTLYGTTLIGGTSECGSGCGTVFSLDPQSGAETVQFSFDNTDGANPNDALLDVNGVLYGTTEYGGTGASCYVEETCGTIFSLDLTDDAETVLHSFCSESRCADGAFPISGVIAKKGLLYGTAFGAHMADCHPNGCGTAFSLDPATGKETTVYTFCSKKNCVDGSEPEGIVDVGDTLYGTTASGGTGAQCAVNRFECGTVFSFDPKTRAETVLYSFCAETNCTDGRIPAGSPIDIKGTLYGLTNIGGADGNGTVFSVNLSTGAETVLYSFCSQANCADGAGPSGSLTDVHGKFYGTTSEGGANGKGTAFMFDPKTGKEQVLYSFCSQNNCADGAYPLRGLIAVNGTFYGTTQQGGAGTACTISGGCGTVFSITP